MKFKTWKLHPSVWAGLTILSLFVLAALFAEWLMPYNMDDLSAPYLRPSIEHLLGTNDIGQDILSELILGTRITLVTGIIAAASVIFVAMGIGLAGGFFGGKVDKVLQAITAVGMTLPQLPFAIVLVTFMSPNMWNIVIAICVTSWAPTAKLIRAKTLEIRQLPFVITQEMMGQSSLVIILKHILPNMNDIIIMRATLAVQSSMLTETSLSFLGLGIYNQKSWGSILYYAFYKNGVIAGMTWWYVPPIICISLCIFGFVLVGYYGLGTRGQGKQKEYQVSP